jgi:hypothetical protein
VHRYKVPTLVVGGGGYTLRNVARCWCYETGRLMGHDLPDKLPDSVLNSFNYYMDNEKLRIEVCTCPGFGCSGRGWLRVWAGGTGGLGFFQHCLGDEGTDPHMLVTGWRRDQGLLLGLLFQAGKEAPAWVAAP